MEKNKQIKLSVTFVERKKSSIKKTSDTFMLSYCPLDGVNMEISFKEFSRISKNSKQIRYKMFTSFSFICLTICL